MSAAIVIRDLLGHLPDATELKRPCWGACWEELDYQDQEDVKHARLRAEQFLANHPESERRSPADRLVDTALAEVALLKETLGEKEVATWCGAPVSELPREALETILLAHASTIGRGGRQGTS